MRRLLAENFTGWVDAIERCLVDGRECLPANTDLRALAEFVLTVMEGAVMQARTYRDVAYFDRSVTQLRTHFAALEQTVSAA